MSSKMKKYLLLLAAVLTVIIGTTISVNAATITSSQTKATQTSITVSWNAVSGADHYVVLYYQKGQDQSQARKVTVSGSRTSYTIKGLKTGKVYYETVEAYSASNACIADEYYFHPAFTTPGKVTTVKPVAWDTKGKGGTFKMTSNPYPDVMDGYQWKFTDRNGNGKKAAGSTTNYGFTTSKLYDNQVYRLYVRGFVNVNGKRQYGPWSYKYVVPQPKINLSLAGSNKIKLTWKKIAGATKYQIYASTSQNSGYKRIATVGAGTNTYTVSKVAGSSLVNYKNYYFKVRAVYTRGGKTYKSLTNNCYYGYIYTQYK